MKILVIPDVHLKPWIFDKADEILQSNKDIDTFVSLGDIADDWDKRNNLNLYEETYDRLIDMVKKYPKSIFCYGNHDISYIWQRHETGYSTAARNIVVNKISELERILGEDRIGFAKKIDNCIFSHAGLCQTFIDWYVPEKYKQSEDMTLRYINEGMYSSELWIDISPIWLRPQEQCINMYEAEKYLQIVGHTPISEIIYDASENVLSVDTFSTYRDGTPIGTQSFAVVDTVAKEWEFIPTQEKDINIDESIEDSFDDCIEERE